MSFLTVFNSHANQVQGHQAQALANALYAYAANIDNLGALGPAVSRISHKHASLYIEAGQYDIVGEYLLKAMGTILGSAFTPSVLGAWSAAYKQLADIMIKMESDMLKEAGDWTSWRDFVIADVVDEAEGIKSFYLKPKDGKALPSYLPGQYISIQMKVPELDDYMQSRQYSLSGAPRSDHYRVSVKKESAVSQDGRLAPSHPGYVSSVLHEQKRAGDVVQLSFPRGDFFLDTRKTIDYPVVLLSAGVGITPMVSIVDTLVDQNHKSPVSLIHATRNTRLIAFSKHVRDLPTNHDNIKVSTFISDPNSDDEVEAKQDYDFAGRMDPDKLDKKKDLHIGDDSASYFICGPSSFMLDMGKKLESYGVNKDKIKMEIFSTSLLS